MVSTIRKILLSGMFKIFRTIAYNTNGMFREFHGILAVMEPDDMDLYRSLLPDQFSMPETPMVSLAVIDYYNVGPWPMTAYLEGAVCLLCTYEGDEGWYVVNMPVTKKVSMMGGRSLGFPKYIADKIDLYPHENGWKGEVVHKGVNELILEFNSTQISLSQKEEQIYNKITAMEDSVYLLVPPAVGPTIHKNTFKHAVTPTIPYLAMGEVNFSIDPKMPWANLVKPEKTVHGGFSRFQGGAIISAEKQNIS